MAINQNHLIEELGGTRCAIVEKNVSEQRAAFLKTLLSYNGLNVVVVPSAPPKQAPAAGAAPGSPNASTTPQAPDASPSTPPPATFSVGVTNLTFNPINAIFGRLLRTPDGHVVTAAYWQQKEAVSHDEIPYFQKRP